MRPTSRSTTSPSSRRVAARPKGRSSSGTGACSDVTRLRGVGDDDEVPRGGGRDLLSQVCAPAALDEPPVGRDLVGAVDRQVQFVEGVERSTMQSQASAPTPRCAATSPRSALARCDARSPLGGRRPSCRCRDRPGCRVRCARRPSRRRGASPPRRSWRQRRLVGHHQ